MEQPRYESLSDLHSAVQAGVEDRSKIKFWVDNDCVNAYRWVDGEQGPLLVRLGWPEEAVVQVLGLLNYDAEHV